MKIGVISDTHGNVEALGKALTLFEGADIIVHAGDVLYHPPRLGFTEGYDIPAFVEALNNLEIPMVIAQGNCDAQVYEELLALPVQSPYAVVEFGGVRLVANHGHLISRDQMIDLGRRYKAQYFISGHTHIPVLEDASGLVLMNPGSPSISKFEINGKLTGTVGLITESGASIISIDNGSEILRHRS